MLCELCKKNEANIVFQVHSPDNVTTHAICHACAHQNQLGMNGFLRSIGLHMRGSSEAKHSLLETLRRYAKVESMTENTEGVSEAFTEEQGQVKTVSSPFEGDRQQKPDETSHIAHQLRAAIVSEDYELAAALRDSLKGSSDHKKDAE